MLRSLKIVLALVFFIGGCTSKPASQAVDSTRSPANSDEPPMCENFAMNKVAHSLTRNLCTMDYIWSLVGPEGSKPDVTTCAASYVVTGAAVAGSSALIGRRLLNGDGSFQRMIVSERSAVSRATPNVINWVKELEEKVFVNAPALTEADRKVVDGYRYSENQRTRIRHQAMMRMFEQYNMDYSRKFLGSYTSSTLEAIRLQPNRRIRVHFGGPATDPVFLGVTPGPTETQARIGKSLTRLAYLGGLTMATGGILFVVDQIMGASPTACSQVDEQYFSADPNNNCRPRMAISQEIVKVLNMDETEQHRIFATFPHLCQVYDQVSDATDKQMAKDFDAASVVGRCERNALNVSVTMANATKHDVEIDRKEIRVLTSSDRIWANYERTEAGMKLTSIRWAPFVGGVKPRTFKLPVDSDTFNTPAFQNIASRVGKTMLLMETAGYFDGDCLKGL